MLVMKNTEVPCRGNVHPKILTSNSNQCLLLISLFAHIGYNPIEQHNILTIHVNYIKNNILEKNNKKTKKQKKIST